MSCLKPINVLLCTQVENNSSKKWEQIYMGVKRGSKLLNMFEPWFPHREVMAGLGLLASQ